MEEHSVLAKLLSLNKFMRQFTEETQWRTDTGMHPVKASMELTKNMQMIDYRFLLRRTTIPAQKSSNCRDKHAKPKMIRLAESGHRESDLVIKSNLHKETNPLLVRP